MGRHVWMGDYFFGVLCDDLFSMVEPSIQSTGERHLKGRTPTGGTLGWVGPYQLVERLPYQGGPIEYLARQVGPLEFERICRLKLVPAPSFGGEPRAAAAVAREARVVLRLDHPNIVRLYDLFEHGNQLVLVMEHFSSLSLARLLELQAKQRKKLDERAVWHIAHRLFDALAHAHAATDGAGNGTPIVHSDVRPANVLLASDGRVRLSGFGFARHAGSEESTACRLYGSGPCYVAPEQIEGRFSERVDTFAAALIVWELLTGQSATPDGLGDSDRLSHLSNRQVESLRILRADLPPLVTTALDDCLGADPDDRTMHAEEVAGCIAAAMDPGAGVATLAEAVVSLGTLWEGLATGDPVSISSPRSAKNLPSSSSRKPAFSVVPPVDRGPALCDAVPSWEEVTHKHQLPQTSLVGPPLTSPGVAMRPGTQPPGSEPGPVASMFQPAQSLTSTSRLIDTAQDTDRASGVRQWVMALPLVMVVAVVTFAVVGTLRQSTPATPATPAGRAVAEATDCAEPALAVKATASAPNEWKSVPSAVQPAFNDLRGVAAPIPQDRAVLVVKGPPTGFVYVQGAMVGKTDEPIETTCGKRFVRVGTEAGEHGMTDVVWLAPGQAVLMRCGMQYEFMAGPK